MNAAGLIFLEAFREISQSAVSEQGNLNKIFRKVASHPIKLIAAFFTAPFLILRIAWSVKNPVRRVIAATGLLLAIILAYLAGGFLGSFAGFIFVSLNIGWLAGLGFFFGTALSVFLSVCFSIAVLNTVSFLALKMSAEEVVAYLDATSK